MTQSRASRRVAWRCGALQRVGWFTILAHTRVCDVQPLHPSHVYSVQSTKFTMDRERELEIVLVLALYLRQRRRRKCGRSMWIRGIFTRRQQQGEYHQLLREMRMADPESHFRYLRMSRERFDSLLAMVSKKAML